MKKSFTISLCFFLISILLNPMFARDLKKEVRDKLMYNSSQGREFWIAFPPNDIPTQPEEIIEIYVTSTKNTEVTVESPGTGFRLTKPVTAFKITTFSTAKNDAQLIWEIRESEVVEQKGVRITSDDPISVYAFHGRHFSSDGYLAIPVSSWGTEYVHCCRYDFGFNASHPLAGGFVVIGAYKGTNVRIQLRGVGKGYATTAKGKDIGDTYKIKLDEGETFMVQGDGSTQGIWDISGSSIVSDKPVGVFSYHMRTDIPVSQGIFPGRDHIIEMMPPVSTWGKEYYTVELKRDTDKGDYFRVVSAYASTTWECFWYDRDNGTLLGHLGPITLKNAGDWFEYIEDAFEKGSPGIHSIRGTSVWKADKPFLVLQYSYSHQVDNQILFDPFMFLITPKEQFVPETVFQTPANKQYDNNWFNIIAEHDPDDEEFKDLKSIELDGQPVWNLEPKFLLSKIPTTDLYWAKLRVDPGAHHVTSDTKFSGYIYGFKQVDSYGWPACIAFDDLEECDTLEPVLDFEENCGNYLYTATEYRNGRDGDNPKQVDLGVEDISLLDGSFNYKLIVDSTFKPWPPTYETHFELKVEDKFKPAFAIFAVTDRKFNVAIDSVSYVPDSLMLTPDQFMFGNVRVGAYKDLSAVLTNISTVDIHIDSIALVLNQVYSIEAGGAPPAFDIQPADIHNITIRYTPNREVISDSDFDYDTLIVATGCLEYKFPISGRGVLPHIKIGNWDAGLVSVGNKKCKEGGLKIENPGTDTLYVSGIENVTPPFSISNPTDPEFTFNIPPGEFVMFKDICFEPEDTNRYEIEVTFNNNGEGPDSTSTWKGKGTTPGPIIDSKDWEERRVGTSNNGMLTLTNEGNQELLVNDFTLDAPNPNFSIDKANISPKPPVELYPIGSGQGVEEITIPVNYHPQDENVHHAEVLPVFEDELLNGKIRGNLDGIGILPKIELTNYEFTPRIKRYTTHPDVGVVYVKSTSSSADLYVESIKWENPNQQNFVEVQPFPQDFRITRGTDFPLNIKFIPQENGVLTENIVVVSDAKEGDETVRTYDTAWVKGTAYETEIEIGSIDYGKVLLCSDPEQSFDIINRSPTSDLYIDDIQLTGGDINSFILVSSPTLLKPQETGKVVYQFITDLAKTYHADIEITFHFDGDVEEKQTTTLDGIGYKVDVDLRMTDKIILAPGDTTLFSVNPFEIKISGDGIGEAVITEFNIYLEFATDELRWAGNNGDQLRPGNAINSQNWTITASRTYDPNNNKTLLHINGIGTEAVKSSGGTLAYISFIVMLGTEKEFPIVFDSKTDFGDKSECINYTTNNGIIEPQSCVIDLRKVISYGTDYNLSDVDPNPVSDATMKVDYSVGLPGNTYLDLRDDAGNLIEVLCNQYNDPGTYELNISTDKLSSGVYYLRIKSGPFQDVKRVVIVK